MNPLIYRLFFLASFLLFNGVTQANISLGITPITQSGNSVNLGLVISGLGSASAPSLGGYDFDIGFDPAHLSFDSAVFGDSVLGNQLDLSNFGSNYTTANVGSPGLLNLSELSFDAISDLNTLQADSFTLATLSFNVLNPGTSQLDITINTLSDADGSALLANNTSVAITTVPVPGAVWLMLSGLGVFFRKYPLLTN
ncbi:MAG: hypothetical protein HOO92_09790 [Methylococcaceae bacterium]|nr:hypothetical protein [Methylococcaceae bacterium]